MLLLKEQQGHLGEGWSLGGVSSFVIAYKTFVKSVLPGLRTQLPCTSVCLHQFSPGMRPMSFFIPVKVPH